MKAAYCGNSIQTADNTNKAGDTIAFNGGNDSTISDLRVTGSRVHMCKDFAISCQFFNTGTAQAGSNIEFDNNVVKLCSGGITNLLVSSGQAHTMTGVIVRDNTLKDIGYGVWTYQRFAAPDNCIYGAAAFGNALSCTNFADGDGGSISAGYYDNVVDNYAGFTSAHANTQSGVNTWATSDVTISPNSNTFTNATDDFVSWDVASTCFDPYSGFPSFP